MRVGFYFEDFSPHIGGGYTFENDLFGALVDHKNKSKNSLVVIGRNEISPEFISSDLDYIIINQKKSYGSEVIKRYLIEKSKHFRMIWKSRIEKETTKILIKNGIEVVFYIHPSSCLTLEIPFITIVWDVQHLSQPFFPEVSHYGAWERRENAYRRVLKRAVKIITGTEVGKQDIENFYQIPLNRVKVIPFFTPKFTLNRGLEKDKQVLKKYGIPKNYLLYPAQFWPHKNHSGLLHAARILRDKYHIILPIVFVGSDHGNQKYIEKLVHRLQLTNQIHFLGFIPQIDLISLYKNALALVYLTYFGPDNLPPLEAFALNCPVIASDIPGSREQLGNAALIVEPGNYDQIAYAIKTIYSDSKFREKLIDRGKQRASKWTSEDYIDEIFTIFDNFAPIRHCWSSHVAYQKKKLK